MVVTSCSQLVLVLIAWWQRASATTTVAITPYAPAVVSAPRKNASRSGAWRFAHIHAVRRGDHLKSPPGGDPVSTHSRSSSRSRGAAPAATIDPESTRLKSHHPVKSY